VTRKTGRDSRKGRKFVQGVLEGKSYKQAALDAGYSESVANNTRLQLWNQRSIQEHFRNLMQEVCPPARVMKILDELLDGKVTTIHVVRELRATKIMQAGKLVDGPEEELVIVRADRHETVDNAGRERALRLAGEYGGFAPAKLPPPLVNLSIEEIVANDNEKLRPPTWLASANGQEVLTICGICNAELCEHGLCLACERCKDCAHRTH
jgi:hypothetical protein